jgi:hypothetical protein
MGVYKMYVTKKKIMIYKPSLHQQVFLLNRYSDRCDVESTDCFSDILAIPAAIIILDPEDLSLQEMKQMNEVFKYDSDTIVMFTGHVSPKYYGVLGPATDSIFNDNMKYIVVKDFEEVDEYFR